jgi:hypothetical protein
VRVLVQRALRARFKILFPLLTNRRRHRKVSRKGQSDGKRRPAQARRIDNARHSPARCPSPPNSSIPRRHNRPTSPRSLSNPQDSDRVTGDTTRPTTQTRRNRRSSTNQRPSKTPIRPRRRAIAKRSIHKDPTRPRSSPIPIRTKQSPGKFEGPNSRANNHLTKKPRRLLPNPKNHQLPTSNPLRTIRRKG